MRTENFHGKKTARLLLILCLQAAAVHSGAQEKFRKSPPIPDPLQELRLPSIQSARLSNGLTLAVAQKIASPLMSIQLVIQAGESDSPENIPGVASLMANMIGRGTKQLSAFDIEEKIESIGGEFFASVSVDQTVFTLNVLEEKLDSALEILSSLFLQASFPKVQLENVKRALFYDIIERQKDPEFVAKRQLFRLLCKTHSYRISAYNEDAIKDIGQKDLLAFFDKYYVPNNALLIIGGNMNLTTAIRKVSHYFNTWTPKNLDRRFLSAPAPNSEEIICFVDLPQAQDAMIFLGNVIMPLTSPDYFPFIVLNQILGGTTGSRLFMNLRESKGYAYYAFSSLDFFKSCGIFWIRAKVTPKVITASVQEILKELSASGIDKISSFEIEQAKSFLIGNFPLKNESLDNFAFRASQIVAFNLGEDHWNKHYENIILVNLDRVLSVAQKYFQPIPIIVIVGNMQEVIEDLRGFNKVFVYDVKGKLMMTITKGVEE